MAPCCIASDWLPFEATRAARIRDIFFQHREYDIPQVEAIREAVVHDLPEDEDHPFAVWCRWYRRAATRGSDGERLISWKQNSEYTSNHLFFRSLDTGRLLSMGLADFRVQFYAYPHLWEHWAKCGTEEDILHGVKGYLDWKLVTHMHTILVLRNFHDMNAGDIPLVFVNWTDDELERVLDYFVALSAPKDDRDDKILAEEYESILEMIRAGSKTPCMFQADLLIRALFADPEVEYIPPFIVFISTRAETKARVLFRAPDCAPPLAFLQTLPQACRGASCDTATHHKCKHFIFDRLHVMHPNSHLVRPHNHIRGILCNHWPCHKTEGLVRCSKCKEVRYCSVQHQAQDWSIHKRVCEAR